METCFDEIRLWMSQNHLKLNDDKTEFIIIGSNPQRAKVFVPHIRVGDANIVPSTSVRNLGVIFDSSMSMDDHTSNNYANQFKDLLSAYGLIQHITSPTHRYGHCLDLTSNITIHPGLSDHYAIITDMNL